MCVIFFLYAGMVATATRTILENLDRIPNEDDRTKIAIVCFDTSLYFFSMPVSSPYVLHPPCLLNFVSFPAWHH
jgi:hypothetical protein